MVMPPKTQGRDLIRIKSPAKINLFLAVKGKRADGYHEIITLMSRIRLFDLLTIRFGFKDHAVFCSAPDVPQDHTNLAYRAAVVFSKNLPGPKKHDRMGVHISIKKKIPVGAGMGGGSSNAASVLMGLNRFYGNVFSKKQLMQMGLSLGADVPFFVFKKPALATGIGEHLTAYHGLPPCRILLVFPGIGISTQEVYKNLNLGLTKCEQKLNCLLFKKEAFAGEKHLCNDLETFTESVCPEIGLIKKKLMRHGAEGALMTGSGTTVFGWFTDPDKAGQAFELMSKDEDWAVFLTELMT